jgi:hypothetical protein
MLGDEPPERTIMLWTRSLILVTALALFLGVATPGMDAAELTFVLRIANGRVPQDMRLIRVKKNDVVKLAWSTDKPMQIHLHGYDIEKDLVPGTVTEMTFTARATGRFTVAAHVGKTASGGHAHGDILVTIEVLP